MAGRTLAALLTAGALALTAGAPAAFADSRSELRNATNKPAIRGGIVYKTYCKLCHGEAGDGSGRAAKLFDRTRLVIKPRDENFLRDIIVKGGEAMGKSPVMPVWSDELSQEQIDDVIAYLQLVTDQTRRGEIVYKTNCILCHGVKGNGKGRAAVLYDPPPANLIMSDKNREYMMNIVTLGGKAMGRSDVMPVWGEQITAQEIEDVVHYVRTLIVKNPVE